MAEPLWKFVTANKALLIVMWELFPNHPHLLEAHWDYESFENRAYVSKPILGMRGECVTIFSSNNEILAEVEGKSSLYKTIFQEYFPIQKFGEFYPILGSWVVDGRGLGFCASNDFITSNLFIFFVIFFDFYKKIA